MRIGIAGQIGSGKSAVCQILKESGYTVLNADDLAHELYRSDAVVRDQIRQKLGAEYLTPEGVERTKLSTLVFHDSNALEILESIVHPPLCAYLEALLNAAAAEGPVFLEGALLPKWPAFVAHLDQVWSIEAPEEIRKMRIIARGLSPHEASLRMNRQKLLPALAHPKIRILHNDSSLETLRQRVHDLLVLVG